MYMKDSKQIKDFTYPTLPSGECASTACTFSKYMSLMCFVKIQPSPGTPITSKWACGLDGVHIFNTVSFCICLYCLGLSLGSLRTLFGRPPGPQRHPKVAPRTGPI